VARSFGVIDARSMRFAYCRVKPRARRTGSQVKSSRRFKSRNGFPGRGPQFTSGQGEPAMGSQASISSVLCPRAKLFHAQATVPPCPHKWSVSLTLTFLPSHDGGSKKNFLPNGEIL